MMWFSLLFSSALAAPDHAAALAATSTAVADVFATQDDAWVAFTTTGGEVVVMDTGTWLYYSADVENTVVTSATGGVAVGGDVASPLLFAGLSNKTIQVWSLVAGSNPAATGSIVVPGDPLALAADSTTLYVLYEDPANGPSLQAYDTSAGLYTPLYATPTDLSEDGFVDMDARYSTDESTGIVSVGYLYVAHGGAQLSRIAIGSDSASAVRDNNAEGSVTIEDLWTEDGGSATWFANSGGNTSYGYNSSDSADLDITTPDSPDIGDTFAVGGSGADGWLAFSTMATLYIYSYAGGTSIGEELYQIDEGGGARDIAAITGYGMVGTNLGLEIITSRPWVSVESSATSVSQDETFTLTFSSDIAGAWKVNQQVAGAGLEPTSIDGASGSIDAGGTATATVSLAAVDSSDTRYLVEVQVTPSGSTESGRAGAYIYVNAPAPTPTIDATTVSFGDQRIEIKFDAFDPTTAQSYPIWVSTVAWTADDYPTEGPAYEGPDDWPADGLIAIAENGVVDCVIDGVENGTTYYVAAQSVDTNEDGTTEKSPMSDVYAVTPAETFSVSERLGIESWCGLPLESAGWLGSLAAALVVLRRRRGGSRSALAVGLTLAALAAPGVAQAAPHEDDLTPRNWDFELRYGPFLTQDSAVLTDAFGTSDNRLLRGNVGFTRNLYQIDLGFGLYSDAGGQSTTSGDTSSDSDELTAFPLAVDLTLRLDFWKEQPVVPFARAGGDLWLWNETWVSANDSSGGGTTTAGTFGWHWAAGLFILLDPLDEGSASRLETIAGINDTFLVAEYRQTYSLGTKDLDFTSTELTFGLKFDY